MPSHGQRALQSTVVDAMHLVVTSKWKAVALASALLPLPLLLWLLLQ
jgi:hypothetical protein